MYECSPNADIAMNEAATPSPEISARRATARALHDQGALAEAERAFRDLLRDVPDDVDALNALAVCAHARRQPDEALTYLEQARRAHPQHPATLVNLGVLQRERGHLDAAYAALRRGIELAPDLVDARLRFGELLQAMGRNTEAVPAYYGAIFTAQQRGQWTDEASTPAELRSLVKHAIRFVNARRRDLFMRLLEPLRERYGSAALVRVEKCLAIHLGMLQPNYPDPAQKPKFLYFPDLPTVKAFDRSLFPWYADLEAQIPAIREEMLAMFDGHIGFEPFLGHVSDMATKDLLKGHSGPPSWTAFFFYRHGERNEQNARRCPRTIAAIDAVPTLCRVRAHGPEVCFSALTPGSHILPHYGVTNTRLVTHVPLIIPKGDLALDVSGHTLHWEEGRCFSFDDSYNHESWNRTAHLRVVVLMDVWNPYLTEIEREAIALLVCAIGDFNRSAGI
jgi:aspartate beta-hydroxylase